MVKAIIELPDDILTRFVAYINEVTPDGEYKKPTTPEAVVDAIREFFYNDGFDARGDVTIELANESSCEHAHAIEIPCDHPESGSGLCTNPHTQRCGLVTGKST